MTFVAPQYTSKWEKQGYKVVKVEGHGDKKEFYRVCDSVVRNSRLFKNLCVKIFDKSRQAGISEKWHLVWKNRQKEQQREFKDFIRFSNKTVDKLQAKIAKLEDELKKAKQATKIEHNRLTSARADKRKVSLRSAQLEKGFKLFKNNNRFFTEPLFIKNLHYDIRVRGELFLRCIIAFKEQERAGNIEYNEFIYLATGMHTKAFGKDDIQNRFGSELTRYFGRNITKLMEKGFVGKMDRRQLYYITDEGKAKMKYVMHKAMTQQMKTYWGDTFNDIKITKRELPTEG